MRYLIGLILIICIVIPYQSPSWCVTAIAQPCNSSVNTCPGAERCNHHTGYCQCPVFALNWDGVWAMQSRRGPYTNTDPSSIWSTVYHCDVMPIDLYPGPAFLFRAQGVLLHGAVLVSSMIGIYKLYEARRFNNNLQTVAVILMFINGVLYTIHYSKDPFGPTRTRLEVYLLSYSPAPLSISLYNVVLLFLRDITATQLNRSHEVHCRIMLLIAISIMLFLAFIVILAQLNSDVNEVYYFVFWLVYLALSIIPATRMAIKLNRQLAIPPPSVPQGPLPYQPAGGKPIHQRVVRHNHVPRYKLIRDERTQIIARVPLPHDSYVAEQSAAVEYRVITEASLPMAEIQRIGQLPNRFHPPPLSQRAIDLRRRIVRFMIGSVIFSSLWCIILLTGVLTTDQTFHQQVPVLFVFRVVEVAWNFLMLSTFFPYQTNRHHRRVSQQLQPQPQPQPQQQPLPPPRAPTKPTEPAADEKQLAAVVMDAQALVAPALIQRHATPHAHDNDHHNGVSLEVIRVPPSHATSPRVMVHHDNGTNHDDMTAATGAVTRLASPTLTMTPQALSPPPLVTSPIDAMTLPTSPTPPPSLRPIPMPAVPLPAVLSPSPASSLSLQHAAAAVTVPSVSSPFLFVPRPITPIMEQEHDDESAHTNSHHSNGSGKGNGNDDSGMSASVNATVPRPVVFHFPPSQS